MADANQDRQNDVEWASFAHRLWLSEFVVRLRSDDQRFIYSKVHRGRVKAPVNCCGCNSIDDRPLKLRNERLEVEPTADRNSQADDACSPDVEVRGCGVSLTMLGARRDNGSLPQPLIGIARSRRERSIDPTGGT